MTIPARLRFSPSERATMAHLLHRSDTDGRVDLDPRDIATRTGFDLAAIVAAALLLSQRGVLVLEFDDPDAAP